MKISAFWRHFHEITLTERNWREVFLSNNKILEIFVSVKLFQSFDELKSSAQIFGALTENGALGYKKRTFFQ